VKSRECDEKSRYLSEMAEQLRSIRDSQAQLEREKRLLTDSLQQ
jgi:hypothetical protein